MPLKLLTQAPSAGRDALAGWFVLLVSVAVYAGAVAGSFLEWDDESLLIDQAAWRGLRPSNLAWMFSTIHMAHYMPVTWLTLGLDWELWGLDPRGYHLTSVLLHAASAAVWWAVFRRLLVAAAPGVPRRSASLAAAAGALFWSLGPLRVESVAWITERRGVLSGLFSALTVLFWLRSLDGGSRAARRQTWSLAFFGLALLAKTSAMLLPLALLILDAYPLRRLDHGTRVLLAEKQRLFLMAASGAVIAWIAQARTPEALTSWDVIGPLQRLAVVGYGWAFYAWKTVLPFDLSPLVPLDARLVPSDIQYVAAWSAALALTLVLVLARRRWPGALAAWLAYSILAAPVLGWSHAGWQLVADRYAYLPCVAFGALFAGLSLRLAHEVRALATPLVVLVLVASGALSVSQVRVWRSSETLWTRLVEHAPERAIGHHRLGLALFRAGDAARALESLERAAAGARDPREFDPRYDLARVQLTLGDERSAVSTLETLLADDPAHPGSLLLLEALFTRNGRFADAASLYARAFAADPSFEAARVRRDALRATNPLALDYAGAQLDAARALLRASRPVSAEYHLRNALALTPTDPAARALLRECLAVQHGR